MSFIPFLQAAAPATSGSLLMSVLPFGLIILIFYFFIIRPQNKKQKETEKMIAALKKGDKVVTIGGIYGVVSSTRESTVIVKVDDGTKIEFARTAISSVITDKSEKSAKADTSKTESVKADEEKKEESTQTNSEENK
ncbi:MAG: preprotein translocase subunit YajC [Candidatus Treponema excrementipullorum]|uniref:Sec translocon accessory complex subunit YajC n=1 Tax=Candidatus Treponema excrementipullorum TaxID=2838768 RepID=A0A9E2P096_9SPIR|nr:preprotein translocase subunit YajC [Candidatus Treponema excrementipullorum]MCI6480006.1 preprotein translocase subunit YajC [Spirochaetia bacterium]MCI6953627.1 preprotein translocase subunit YajC [Spirochaetia bacterium]MCI7588183.1 preprotein translocase subunit YajC [Spirochaetia bacterium]MDD7013348.1 preprotein translocase subunit YajC [Candidatus Treponema excrementipullorum]